MINRRNILFSAAAAAAASATRAVAQSTTPSATPVTPSPLLSVALVNVKPDRVADYLELEKTFSDAHLKGGGRRRSAYRNRAGSPFEYMMVSGLNKFAELDEKPAAMRGMSEADYTRLISRRSQCIDSVHTTIEAAVPELRIARGTNGPPHFLRVIRHVARAGMANDLISLMKAEYLPAMKKAEAPFTVSQVRYGGSRNRVTVVHWFDKYAELDQPSPLTRALGADGTAKYLAKSAALLSSSDYQIYAYLPDASSPWPAA